MVYGNREGENNGHARLREREVREIRKRAAEGETQEVLAAAFGVDDSHISLIVRRKRWKHVE